MMLRSKHPIFGLALVLLAAGQVQAQPDPNLKSTYGSVTLKAGFLPDPFSVYVVAGGELKTNLGGVNAHVAKAPDFSLNYTKGTFPLTFHVKSVGDTTLLINLPDGTWLADDDSGGGFDPLIRIANPQSGRYDIFVGTYQKDPIAGSLYITERDFTRPPVPFKANLPECHILSVGVDNYPFLSKLNGDLNDARNTVAAFKNQTGMKFRNVKERILLDGAATHQAILQGFRAFTKQGAPNDFMVLFMSGHGSRTNGNKTWMFCPFDFKSDAQGLTDKQILDVGDELVKQKKYVVIIVDACFSGQMHVTAQPYLNRHKNANEGGMILMLACSGEQTSAALGNYSTFAKAFADGMAGGGDLKKDSKITLGQMQSYTRQRTNELVAGARQPKQDSIVAWSPSISREMPFAYTGNPVLAAAKPTPTESFTNWEGSETLPGFGKLSFKTYSNGRAVMVDAQSTTEGIWRKTGNQFTLSFANGAIVYTGTVNGATLAGTASSPAARDLARKSWTWTVKRG
jgi:Caspase domain